MNEHERDIAVQRGVIALGIAVCPPTASRACRDTLETMGGDDWAILPYSLAKSIYDTMELHIIRKLPYLAEGGGHKLIQFDAGKGEVRLTELGENAMRRLANKLQRNTQK
jgi:hypothetical protein